MKDLIRAWKKYKQMMTENWKKEMDLYKKACNDAQEKLNKDLDKEEKKTGRRPYAIVVIDGHPPTLDITWMGFINYLSNKIK